MVEEWQRQRQQQQQQAATVEAAIPTGARLAAPYHLRILRPAANSGNCQITPVSSSSEMMAVQEEQTTAATKIQAIKRGKDGRTKAAQKASGGGGGRTGVPADAAKRIASQSGAAANTVDTSTVLHVQAKKEESIVLSGTA
jgi:hypothetical protein